MSVYAVTVALFVVASTCYAQSDVTLKLLHKVLENAGKKARPNADVAGSPVNITLGFTITRLHQDVAPDALRTHGFISHVWKDPRLTWDPKSYGEISSLVVPIRSIWYPDITFYNSADANDATFSGSDDRPEQKLALVQSDGTVIWVPKASQLFQYNTLGNGKFEATLLFGSWVHSDVMVDVTPDKAAVDVDQAEWKSALVVKSSNIIRVNKVYPCCPGVGYPRLEVKLFIESK